MGERQLKSFQRGEQSRPEHGSQFRALKQIITFEFAPLFASSINHAPWDKKAFIDDQILGGATGKVVEPTYRAGIGTDGRIGLTQTL